MTIEILNKVFPVINLIKDLGEDELIFLEKYITSTLADDFKDMFHHFVAAQVGFIEEEIEKKF
jgi:hypothetical protein